MATQKVTLSLPKALSAKLQARSRLLARAYEIANRSRPIQKLERELDALNHESAEPWDESAYRRGLVGKPGSYTGICFYNSSLIIYILVFSFSSRRSASSSVASFLQ